jgi:natural product biosynthesis luciferase-like monooxygenase protein
MERGISTVRVVPGEAYTHEKDLVTIRGASAEDYVRLVQEVPFAGVIHRWSRRGFTLDEALERGMYSVHRLVQALLKSGKAMPLVYAYPPGEVAYEAVIGYAKSLRQEQPKLRLKTVGIDRTTDNLLAELSDERSEIRYLGDQREIRTLEELSIRFSAEAPLARGGVYIVSGGAGGLGRIFAEYLVQKYSARLVLAGRSELSEANRRFLEPLGEHAIYCRADVSTPEGANQVVHEAKQRYGALNGVIHAAGGLRDGLIWNKSQEDFAAVLRPKVRGVEALDAATSQEPLDYFILFSSTAGLLGNAGQSDYAYANAYLDAFAHKREELRRAGQRRGRTLSLNWPLWREGGMRGTLEGTAADALGLQLLERSAGLEIFEQVLASHEVQVWGCAGDRGKIRTRLLERRPQTQAKKSVPPGSAVPATSISPAAVTPDQIIDYLIRQFAEVTKLPLAQIHADEPIENYGVDSIMVTTFAQMLEHDLGELSKTLLFEYPTIEALADNLLKNHAATFAALFGTMSAQNVERAEPDRLEASESVKKRANDSSEDIAIIGVFGRYPQADDLDEFWANLAAGKDCIEEVPADRWNYRDHYDPEPGKPGKTSNKWGGFLKDMDKFDPLFFNISPREAQFMDPQERIFLETVWKTVEDAGYSKAALNERKVGVFVGVMYGQYQLFGIEERLRGNPISLSSSFATIANRVSYFFNWHGPSLAVDTMCSASLTSVHLACESLKRGECEFAIAGGVNTTVHPEKDIVLSQSGFSANDGRCKTFGDDGSGYVPGEGVGALLLKPLSCAEADRDHIWGVIKGSSLNHGGKTNGYTVPNSKSQTEVVLDTLRKAKIDPATINYIEAHGTGTVLGDPIEITGLQQAFTEALDQGKDQMTAGRPPRQFCAVGSVKSNIGHCESAAGIAGVTKLLLQLKHGKLVPSLHAERLNPNIKFEETFFRVQRCLEDWEPVRVGRQILPRRAGVSSFGAGGANAHLIIEEYAVSATVAASHAGPVLIVLSAKKTERLRESASNLVHYLESHLLGVPTRERFPTGQLADEQTAATAKEQSVLRDVAYTLQVGREAFEERVALKVTSVSECVTKLKAWIDGAETDGLYHGNTKKALPALEELRKNGSPEETVASFLRDRKLDGVAELWIAGVPVNWAILYRDSLPRRVSLPTYPFARHRYWVPKRGFFDPPRREGNGEAAQVGNSGTGPVNRNDSAEQQLPARIEVLEPPVSSEATHHGENGRPALDFSIMFFSDNSQVTSQNKYELVLEAAKFADQHGFEAIWTPERHFHPFGGIYSSPATLMAALATATRRIRLRAGSVVLPLADPLRVAEAWAVVDNLSDGRVDLAFASGWNPNDFALAPEVYSRLRDVWLERIPQVQSLWRGESIERVNGKGETVKLRVYPGPRQKDLPVWLTASRRLETFINAGQRGYNVLTMLQGSTVAQLAEKIARYREARQQAGWEPQAGKVTLMLHTFVHPDADYARRLVREPFLEYIRSSLDAHKTAFNGGDQLSSDDLHKMAELSYERYSREASLIGDPVSCFEMVKKCRDIGVNDIACLVDFGADASSVIASLPHLDQLRQLSVSRFGPLSKRERDLVHRPAEIIGVAGPSSENLNGGDLPAWFFTPDWIESPAEVTEPRTAESLLFVHSGENPLQRALIETCRTKSVNSIKLGNQNRRLGPNEWEVDVENKGATELCLSQLTRPDLICFTGAMGLVPEGDEVARVDHAQKHGTMALVRLVQALDRLGWMEPPQAIRIMTAGAHAVFDEPVAPYAASLSGLSGSLAKEYPRLDIACLDVNPREFEKVSMVRQFAHFIATEPAQRSSQKIALRNGRRFRLRLRLAEMPPNEKSRFRQGGVYLILGGAGSVGFHLSLYLARKFGAKLLWVGRRPLDSEIEEHTEQIRLAGGEALYFQARGHDLPEMNQAVEMVQQRFGTLNGVIHSALVFQSELLRNLDESVLQEVLNSKIRTAAVLAELTHEMPLDFLLFLGSAQSFFNEARRSAYAAGCCFVDAYARLIQQRVTFPVHVINWGFWSHSFDLPIQQTMRAAGLGVIQAQDGMPAIERVLAAGPIQAGFLKADSEALRRMDINPAEQLVYLPETENGELETELAAKLFE